MGLLGKKVKLTKKADGAQSVQIDGKYAGTLPSRKSKQSPTASLLSSKTHKQAVKERVKGVSSAWNAGEKYRAAIQESEALQAKKLADEQAEVLGIQVKQQFQETLKRELKDANAFLSGAFSSFAQGTHSTPDYQNIYPLDKQLWESYYDKDLMNPIIYGSDKKIKAVMLSKVSEDWIPKFSGYASEKKKQHYTIFPIVSEDDADQNLILKLIDDKVQEIKGRDHILATAFLKIKIENEQVISHYIKNGWEVSNVDENDPGYLYVRSPAYHGKGKYPRDYYDGWA